MARTPGRYVGRGGGDGRYGGRCHGPNATPARAALVGGGTWAQVPGPSATEPQPEALNAISCTSASACTAVGGSLASGTFVATWDGHAWTAASTPPANPDSELRGVSCTSASFCVAVGSIDSGSGAGPLIERWDGSSWAVAVRPTGFDVNATGLVAFVPPGPDTCSTPGGPCPSATQPLPPQAYVLSWSAITFPTGTCPAGRYFGESGGVATCVPYAYLPGGTAAQPNDDTACPAGAALQVAKLTGTPCTRQQAPYDVVVPVPAAR